MYSSYELGVFGMIELYTWPTPNGHKIHIMLEEIGLDYLVKAIDIDKGDQFDPEFLKISPNNKMPAIIDRDGPNGERYSLFESGAILMYLAEKSGQFMQQDLIQRYQVIQWLMFQMGSVGPMFGQAHHFRQYAPEEISYAVKRYTNEVSRLYRVINQRLEKNEYLAGDYSIADIAVFPWTRSFERQGQKLDDYPNVKRWYEIINSRPAVKRALAVLAERRNSKVKKDDEAINNLFGAEQYKKR
jgi:GST-like protein